MKRIIDFSQFINERAIMPSDFSEMLDSIREACIFRPLTTRQLNEISEPYDVIFVTYDEFLDGLPEHLKNTAPPRDGGIPIFGYIDSMNRINVVMIIPMLGIRELPFVNHIIQHESVHKGQWERRPEEIKWTLPDPNNRKEYFSNVDEIMAFSQSIAEMLMNQQRLSDLKMLPNELKRNPLWRDIKNYVDDRTKSRYLKYIYEYIKNYLGGTDEYYDDVFKEIMNSRKALSEGMEYHIQNEISICESVFRIGSDAWIDLIEEARQLWESGEVELIGDDLFIISTNVGEKAIYEGEGVLLEIPFEDEDADLDGNEEMEEAEYRGKNIDLNKPFRTPGGPRKFSVFTKNEKGSVVKVSFGEPGMRVNNADPKKSRSFRKRMRCEDPGPKWKPKYWSCNVGRYAKLLGLSSSRPW